ncbi:MAG: hypothetical protein Q4Q03_08350 [Bowdeniella nasicola]|nr:hypothetical protein [Bowdeniella nasicola]
MTDSPEEQREANADAEMAEITAATRQMFSRIIRELVIATIIIAAVGAAGGGLIDGMRGVWGALLATAVAAFFIITTVVVMYVTAAQHVFLAGAATMAAWVVKMLLVFFVLIAVRGRDFYHPGIFLATLAAVIIASTAIEMRALHQARIPYVQPGIRRPRKQ